MASRPGYRPPWADVSRPDGVRIRHLEKAIRVNFNKLRWAKTSEDADYILEQLEPQLMTLAQLDPRHPLLSYKPGF